MASDQVEQNGSVSPNHPVAWVTDGVIGDGGTSTNGVLSGVGVTLISGSGSGYGLNDAPITGPYHQLLLGVGTNGHGFLSWQNFGTAVATPFDFIINGVTITIGGTNWLSAVFDQQFGSAQGDLVYRNNLDWVALPPGTAGQVLTTQGPSANPSWSTVLGTGTVQTVNSGNGLTGGAITSTGSLAVIFPYPTSLGGVGGTSFAANALLVGNGTGPLQVTSIGAAGQALMSNGTVGVPSWATLPGTGTVQSIVTVQGIKGGPITTSGTITLDPTTAIQSTVNILSGSGTYTVPVVNGIRAQTLFVCMRGDGGGGGGTGANPMQGAIGTGVSFAGIVAAGGDGGLNPPSGVPMLGGNGAAGGTGGTGGALQRIPGAPGGNGISATSSYASNAGGNGGGAGGLGGPADTVGASHNGSAAASASGGGGGGGAANTASPTAYGSGGGGGEGEYVELLISSPSITYPYIVGTGGAGGTGSLANGGNGGSGWIRVESRWQ